MLAEEIREKGKKPRRSRRGSDSCFFMPYFGLRVATAKHPRGSRVPTRWIKKKTPRFGHLSANRVGSLNGFDSKLLILLLFIIIIRLFNFSIICFVNEYLKKSKLIKNSNILDIIYRIL